MIKIESGIPIPPRAIYGTYSRTLKTMAAGDSILVDSLNAARAVYQAAKRNGLAVTTRKVNGGGIRIWRVGGA